MMPTPTMPEAYGLSHFLLQSNVVELIPLYLLGLMSIASWCAIAAKAIQAIRVRRHGAAFLRRGWNDGDAGALQSYLVQHAGRDPWSRLAAGGIVARRQVAGLSHDTPLGAPDQFLIRALRRAIGNETIALESGLTLLATVASAAPFVGLFGTVWGIYHALIAIGTSGQSSLDQVAGPVGEALIMTAFGLATALPAVLGYNLFVRFNRRILSDLDGFAHDLFVFLSSAIRADDEGTVTSVSRRLAAAGKRSA